MAAIKHILPKALLLLILFMVGDMLVFRTLKAGMDQYYGMDKPAEILCIGHSHTVLGIDAARIEEELGLPVAKYATAGANTLDRYWMLRQFIDSHPSVKVVVYDVDARLFDSEGLSSASYTLFLPYIDDQSMAEYLKQEATWQEYTTSRFIRSARFRDQTINIALRGLLGKTENKKSSTMQVENFANYLEREKERQIIINPESMQYLQKSIDFLTDRGIKLVLVYIPVSDLLNDIDASGQAAVDDIFKTMDHANPNVIFIDYNQDLQHRHDLFYDLRHMNAKGNQLVTDQIISDLKKLLYSSTLVLSQRNGRTD
jgi:hypothetical protein